MVAPTAGARLLPDHAEQPRLERGVSVELQPALDHADVHVLQQVLRVFAPAAATRHCPAEALRMERLHLRRQIGVAHAHVSARALYGHECVERARHMTTYGEIWERIYLSALCVLCGLIDTTHGQETRWHRLGVGGALHDRRRGHLCFSGTLRL